MICDVHAHCLPQQADRFLLDKYGINALMRPVFIPQNSPASDVDIEARVAMMDDAGVQWQILSMPPLPTLGDEADTVKMVRMVNDAHASMVAQYPDRFQAYIELPLPYLDASLAELERCRTEHGMHSVNILMSHGTTSAIAEEYDRLFATINETETIVFFHPRVSGLCSPLITDYGLTPSVGPAVEDTVLVAQMIVRQFPMKFPNLRIVIPHLGGMLPIYLNRMDNQMARALPDLPEKPSAIVRRLWFDTLVHSSAVALRAAREAFGVDRLVTGSDYPSLEHFEGYKASFDYICHAGLSDADVHQIMHVNAPRLFGLD